MNYSGFLAEILNSEVSAELVALRADGDVDITPPNGVLSGFIENDSLFLGNTSGSLSRVSNESTSWADGVGCSPRIRRSDSRSSNRVKFSNAFQIKIYLARKNTYKTQLHKKQYLLRRIVNDILIENSVSVKTVVFTRALNGCTWLLENIT